MKKLNKLVAILVAMAMVLSLSIIAAFAENADDDEQSANFKMVKYFKMPAGVTLPGETFTFHVDADANNPAGGPADFDWTGIADSTMTASASEEDGGSLVKAVSVKDDVFAGKDFAKAGVYTFTVTENAGTNDYITYAEDSYIVRLYVTNDGDGTTISNITVENEDGQKEKANIEDPTVNDDDVNDGDAGKGFTFVNEYSAEDVIRTPETAALELTKEISGDYADASFDYPFTITVVNDDYKGDTTIPVTINGVADTITLGTAKNFTLQSGQKFVIVNLPAGTTYTVTENLKNCGVQNEANYTANADKTSGIEITKAWGESTTAVADTNLTVESATAITDATPQVKNAVTVTNTAANPTPEGILISNLPYIALALVAIGGLVAYVVIRRRNADEA